MKRLKNFFQKMKSRHLAIDELSLFLITIALIFSLLMTIFRLNRFVILTWIPVFIAYWRSYSKNRLQRLKENHIFIKYYDPFNSWIKNVSRRFVRKESHIYFKCKSCNQQLRIPKKTDHIKVTCPKCNYSFIKKTVHGYISKTKKKNV
jgi:predicted RNA-binding Zn-ribbon protein involved in translation (DUF1610 family)